MPTLLLLDRLFAYLASEPGTSTGPPSSGENDAGSRSDGSVSSASVRETHIHLQDYNRSVLELVTFPNVLLTWCPSSYHLTSRHSCPLKNPLTDLSPLSTVYRASSTDSDSDLDGNEDENEEGKKATPGRRNAHGRKPGGLTVTQGLLDAFTGPCRTRWCSLRCASSRPRCSTSALVEACKGSCVRSRKRTARYARCGSIVRV